MLFKNLQPCMRIYYVRTDTWPYRHGLIERQHLEGRQLCPNPSPRFQSNDSIFIHGYSVKSHSKKQYDIWFDFSTIFLAKL